MQYDAFAVCKKLRKITRKMLINTALLAVHSSGQVRHLLDVMEYDTPYTAAQIMTALGLKSKENLRKLYIGPALEMGLIVMGLPDKPTSRNQTYRKK